MKRQSPIAITKPVRGSQGFALIATMTVMGLLIVVALGMLSISTVSLRHSTIDAANAEARANARLALMIAIGELQEALGPDKRISASAAILDTNPMSPTIDGVDHPHYIGVWDSWDTWLTDNKGSLDIQDTYKRGRDSSLFRKWLVSSSNGQDINFALNDPGDQNMVLICGEGSVGADPANQVRVPLVSLSDGRGESGRYAWWVADEAQKARIDMSPREEPASASEALVTSSHTGRMGVEKLTNMDTFDTSPESLAKMISLGLAEISGNGVPQNFHALTTHSVGLFTDVRSGGFKSDINLAFESDAGPSQMEPMPLFGGRPFDPPIRPFSGELANVTPQNPYIGPMGWRSLREYYRLYRAFPTTVYHQPVQWQGDQPVTNRFLMASATSQNMWDVAGYARQPVLLRQTWILATMTENDPASADGRAYYVIAVPVVSLWNPYNVPLEINSTEISTFGTMYFTAALHHKVYRGGDLLEEGRFPSGSVLIGTRTRGDGVVVDVRVNNPVTSNQDGYRMIPVEPGLGVIRFEPGEVRVFSTDSDLSQATNLYAGTGAQGNRHFVASPGYTPIQSGAGGLRGLKNRVSSGRTDSGDLSMSLRLAVAPSNQIDTFWAGGSKTSVVGYLFQERFGDQQGLYLPNGSSMNAFSYNEWHNVYRLSLFSIDWLRSDEVDSAWLIDDSPAARAQWPAPGSTPLPIGILSIVAKSPEQLDFMSSGGFSKDYRNRGWLHSPITAFGGTYLINPNDLTRSNSAYQIHFTSANSDVDVSQYLEADGRNGFFGGGYSQSEGVKQVSALHIPAAPTTSLAAFAGAAVSPSRSFTDQISDNHTGPSIPRPSGNLAYRNRKYYTLKHSAITGAAFGAGIGNAYAHPMIDADEVYTRHDIGSDPGWDGAGTNSNNFAMCDDYWDHLFLSNEELWDSWFCSNIAPAMDRGSIARSLRNVAIDFFNHESTRLPSHYFPYAGGKTATELGDLVEVDDAAFGNNGWDKIGAHILNKGQFNVNSTSKAAWKAMLMSLAERPFAVGANGDGISVADGGEEVTLTRHPLANGETSGFGPGDENSWRGMRTLTDAQIDKLAEEMVRQVKLRGPFLNMADFINRRLSDDELGVTGALQAAIDWDEFNAGYDGTTSGTGESINGEFKDSAAMIRKSQLPANYPNEMAAAGSLYAGIPGYVMQSDILQGIGNSLSVRGDTFMIRAYGESLSSTGEVMAKAWCEAVIQRVPDYVDDADAADTKIRSEDGLPYEPSTLSPANEIYGRQMHIVSFRWLSQDEI